MLLVLFSQGVSASLGCGTNSIEDQNKCASDATTFYYLLVVLTIGSFLAFIFSVTNNEQREFLRPDIVKIAVGLFFSIYLWIFLILNGYPYQFSLILRTGSNYIPFLDVFFVVLAPYFFFCALAYAAKKIGNKLFGNKALQ